MVYGNRRYNVIHQTDLLESNEMENLRYFGGDEWEARIHVLLRCHHKPGDYLEVPDRDGGDAGLDGFSMDGVVYQCYAPEEPLPVDKLYELCRDKITTDLGKFMRNRVKVAGILGLTQVKKWLLVVPRLESAKLLQHANEKAADVRAAKLSYVASDFVAGVITDDTFRKEQQILALSRGQGITLQLPAVPSRPRSDWEGEHTTPGLQSNLKRKIASLPVTNPNTYEENLIDSYLRGSAFLDMLAKDYPSFYQEILSRKSKREGTLRTQAMFSSDAPVGYIRTLIDKIEDELTSVIQGLPDGDATLIAHEFVADWLLRCPLDFPTGKRDAK